MTLVLPRSDHPRVSIVIPCSVRTDLLHHCLRSLARSGPRDIAYETIVVLNEVDAGIDAELTGAISGVTFARAPVNLGVAGACNLGRSLARGEFVLLLHDDAEVQSGWMEALVEVADADARAGAIGSKVLYPDGRLQNAGSILWRNALTSARPADETLSVVEPYAVDYCGTASLLVRASAWDAVGGFDEAFYPAYYADVDLCMALRAAGYVVLCQPRSRIFHHRNASTTQRLREFIWPRNKAHFEKKWATALEQYEPFDDNSSASIARAVARANRTAEQCRAADAPTGTHRTKAAFEIDEYYARAYALERGFADYLDQIVKGTEADRSNLQEQTTVLARDKQELERAHKMLARRHEELAHANKALLLQNQALRRQYAELAQARDAIFRSRSWRITRPLRFLAGLFGNRNQ